MRHTVRAALCAVLLALPVRAAGQDEGAFDVRIAGVTAAVLGFRLDERDGRYRAAGTLTTTGLIGLFTKVRYTGFAEGRLRGGRPVPGRFVETVERGGKRAAAELVYEAGVPRLVRYEAPRPVGPDTPDPATQGGTVDPMSVIYAALRPVPAAEACARRFEVFDGKRRSRVTLSAPRRNGAGIVCAGEYRRLRGFPPEDMAERERFGFRLLYVPGADGRVRLDGAEFDTLYGKAVLDRR